MLSFDSLKQRMLRDHDFRMAYLDEAINSHFEIDIPSVTDHMVADYYNYMGCGTARGGSHACTSFTPCIRLYVHLLLYIQRWYEGVKYG